MEREAEILRDLWVPILLLIYVYIYIIITIIIIIIIYIEIFAVAHGLCHPTFACGRWIWWSWSHFCALGGMDTKIFYLR